MLKKGDFLVFGLILALSLILIFSLFSGGGKYVLVTVEGVEYGKYPLATENQIEIKSQTGTNTLIIKEGKAHFEHSNCPDKTCQKTGEIAKIGQTIVCLPHRVIAEVTE